MDKRKPTYLRKDVKNLISNNNFILTKRSLGDAHSLGFSLAGVGDVISNLTSDDFYKTTDSYNNSSVWQDVYKTEVRNIALYIKFKVTSDGQKLVVTSFKRQ